MWTVEIVIVITAGSILLGLALNWGYVWISEKFSDKDARWQRR